jgi:hypothetical protein
MKRLAGLADRMQEWLWKPFQPHFELEEAQFFPLDALSAQYFRATLRRIEERGGKRIKDGI